MTLVSVLGDLITTTPKTAQTFESPNGQGYAVVRCWQAQGEPSWLQQQNGYNLLNKKMTHPSQTRKAALFSPHKVPLLLCRQFSCALSLNRHTKSESYNFFFFNSFPSRCLPLAMMYKCKVVLITCILRSLFLLIFYIWLIFCLLHVILLSSVSFCSLLFPVVLCICSCYPMQRFVLCVTV